MADVSFDPRLEIWRIGVGKFFDRSGESDASKIARLEIEVETGRPRVYIGKGLNPKTRVTYTPEALEKKRDELADLYEKYGIEAGKFGITLGGLRGVTTPPPIAPPPIAPPIVTQPPSVLGPPPRVVTGEVLTPSQTRAYNEALRQLRTAEALAKFGGRGSVGGALRLGAALWNEFGAEILVENARKAEAARAASSRKGPSSRRAKTAKRGEIRRPGAGNPVTPPPPKPPPPPPRVPLQAPAQTRAAAELPNQVTADQAREAAQASKGPKTRARGRASSSSSSSSSQQPRIATGPPLPSSQQLALNWAATIAAAKLAGSRAVQAANSALTSLATATQTATGGGAGLNFRSLTAEATGDPKGEKCRVVCRKPGKKGKRKKSRKVCVDKSALSRFVNQLRAKK